MRVDVVQQEAPDTCQKVLDSGSGAREINCSETLAGDVGW